MGQEVIKGSLQEKTQSNLPLKPSTYKTERDRLQEQNSACQWEETVRDFGMDMYTLLYFKWITNKDPLYMELYSLLWSAWIGEGFGGEWIHVHVG